MKFIGLSCRECCRDLLMSLLYQKHKLMSGGLVVLRHPIPLKTSKKLGNRHMRCEDILYGEIVANILGTCCRATSKNFNLYRFKTSQSNHRYQSWRKCLHPPDSYTMSANSRRVCCTMTINKAQEQKLKVTGVDPAITIIIADVLW